MIPRIRLRILRHKWKNYCHGHWLLMFQSHWPFIEFIGRRMEYDEVAELLCASNTSSLDIILEYYDENGWCGKRIL